MAAEEKTYTVKIFRDAATGERLSEYWLVPRETTDNTALLSSLVGYPDMVFDRSDGPASLCRDIGFGHVREQWSRRGELHRIGGPAISCYEHLSGFIFEEEWWQDGQLHRVGGPAVVRRDVKTGTITEQWWTHGRRVRRPGASRDRAPKLSGSRP